MNAETMIAQQLRPRGIVDGRVLEAMRKVPRERFLPNPLKSQAYEDHPLPIGLGQTISQPYIVAFMTQALALSPGQRVLEIGTGCGYQTAILAEMGVSVYTVEILPELARMARVHLQELGYDVHFLEGDGHQGWPENAPYDAILVAAAPETLPPQLFEQLAVKGRMIIPVGPRSGIQELNYFKKSRDKAISKHTLLNVRFVPMVKHSSE